MNEYLVGLRLNGRKVVVVGGGGVAQRRVPLLVSNGADVHVITRRPPRRWRRSPSRSPESP